VAAAVPGARVPGRLPGTVAEARLANGLHVCVLTNRQAPIVTSALWYRAGTRDEPAGHGGIAHFLEHMMFKGSEHFAGGEIDRRTQALGGDNNAFTSHDATAYYFNLAADRWRLALAIEADRMAGLTLDPAEVESERRVILEEIAMYEAEPWDALEERVLAALFGAHPYARPVLGTRGELLATGRDDLAAFHASAYRPSNAVLVVAGDVGEEAFAAVEEAFGGVADRPAALHGDALPGAAVLAAAGTSAAVTSAAPAAAVPAAVVTSSVPAAGSPTAAPSAGPRRVEQRLGEVPRLMIAFRVPPASHADHAALRITSVVLGSGRASRLQRLLVDEEELCSVASADLSESVEPGTFTVTCELVPGADPARVEALVLGELVALAFGERPPSAAELERARRVTAADWVFGHEKVHQQALATGFALALFDLGHAEREMARALAAGPEEVVAAAARHLDLGAAVVGWSRPRPGGER
jgi:zinc protease